MLNLVRFWILLSALLAGGGWILSALHQLNRAGYAALLSPLAVMVFCWWRKHRPLSPENLQRLRCKFSKRYRRRVPRWYLVIATLSLLAGSLYPPMNYNAVSYRLPRVMHWLAAGQWNTIHTFDARMNIAACGIEWLSAPLILFSHSDRLLFLINWISYLMLPGLIFSVFTRLQVRPRAAWWWAWLLPAGLCFALQAGSVANDSFAAVYILAAVDLALRARQHNSITDFWLSLLAAALVTGAKQMNLPLVGLWFIAAWPARSLLWRYPWRTGAVAVVGLLASIVPISLLNYHQYGSWMPLNITGIGDFHLSPFWGIVGNAFSIPVQNLVPPFYGLYPPFYSFWPVLWNELMHHFLQTPLGAHFRSFEDFGFLGVAFFHGFTEETMGLGLGLCILVAATLRERWRLKKKCAIPSAVPAPDPVLRLLRVVPWALLPVFMAKDGAIESARHLAPYYLLLFPGWLVGAGHAEVTRRFQWQQLAWQIQVLTVLIVVTLSDRPLFPAQTFFRLAQSEFPHSGLIADECVHYLEANHPRDIARRRFIQQALPTQEKTVAIFAQIPSVVELT